MIPLRQSVYRGISRGSLYKLRHVPIILNRFQSTSEAPSTVITPTEIVTPIEVVNKTKPRKKIQREINAKLKDITNQVKESITNALPTDLSESYEILEDGISYVRQIQSDEGISESDIVYQFTTLAVTIFEKALNPGASLGKKRTIQDLFNMLIEQRIAEAYHFIQMSAYYIQHEEERTVAFDKVIKLWVDFLEYREVEQVVGLKLPTVRSQARMYDFTNFVIYAYVLSCTNKNLPFSIESILKLVRLEKISRNFLIRKTLEDFNVFQEDEFQNFKRNLNLQSAREFNPDGALVSQQLNEAMIQRDHKKIWHIYNNIQRSCAENNKRVSVITLEKVMYAFQQVERPDDVFEIFQAMIDQKIIPSPHAWSIILLTLAKPNTAGSQDRQSKIENFERTIATIRASKVEMTPKLLSAIVTGFANFDCFDKVDEYIQTYNMTTLSSAGKDGILIGLVLNDKINQANAKLDEYLQDRSGFIPSSTTINVFLDYYVKEKNYKAADAVIDFMKKHNIAVTHPITTTRITSYCKQQFDKGLEPDVGVIIDIIKESNKTYLNAYALASMIDSLSLTSMDVARTIYGYAVKFKPNEAASHTAMIKAELTYGDIVKARQVFEYVIKNVKNDVRLWNMVIRGFLYKDENSALQYYERMKQERLKPNQFTFYFLINHFLRKNNNILVERLIRDLAETKLSSLGEQLPKTIIELSDRMQIPSTLLNQAQKELSS